jgi:hypothetical protein
MLIGIRTVALIMPDEKTQQELIKDAKKIIRSIEDEVVRLKKEGKLDRKMLLVINRIKKNTKNLMDEIRDIVFHQTKLTDFK